MFERLFKYPRVLARHREGPFAEARERFLVHCANDGLACGTLLRIARELLVVATRIDTTAETPITRQQIEGAAQRWTRHQRRRGRIGEPSGSRQLFIQVALRPRPVRHGYVGPMNTVLPVSNKNGHLQPVLIGRRSWSPEPRAAWTPFRPASPTR